MVRVAGLVLVACSILVAGGPHASAASSADQADLLAWLPADPPPGFGLDPDAVTVTDPGGADIDLYADDQVESELARRSAVVARAWSGPEVAVVVSITRYPYGITAAAARHLSVDTDLDPLTTEPIEGLEGAWTFREPDRSRVGVVERRGDILITVLAGYARPDAERASALLALSVALDVAGRVPPGATDPYDPEPPSRFAGLGLTAVLVAAAAGGSRTIAMLRAKRVRRRWAAVEATVDDVRAGASHLGFDVDPDASALRRRGLALAVIQLMTVVVGVVALAGDFATLGVVVAALALLTGLAVSRWWVGRELALLGPAAPRRPFLVPRLPGLLLGLVTFVVLGIGVAYFLKGVRYLVLPIGLAQLRWSGLLGLAPRAVGLTFALGGLLVTALGAVMYRVARILGRADARRVLAADTRPPALYLRSFDDDSLPLPTIASARRPLFELFSFRGADPFEEAVAWELGTYAPVVAVGRPKASLQTLGAAREHLADDRWQAEVANRMHDAAVIVLAPAETPGLAWELTQIVAGGHLQKTVFVFPPVAPDELARRWRRTDEVVRSAGAPLDRLGASVGRVHTVRIDRAGDVGVTIASVRDEATYRAAIDRALGSASPGAPVG